MKRLSRLKRDGKFHLAKKIKLTDEFLVPICFP